MSTTGRRPGTVAPRGAVLTVLFTVAVVHLSVGVCRSLSSNGLTRDGVSREMDPVLDQRQPGESSATDPSGETPFSGAADPSEPLPFVRTGPEGGGGDGAVRTAPFLLMSGRRRSLAEGLQVRRTPLCSRTPPCRRIPPCSRTPPCIRHQHLLWWRDYRSPNTSSGGGTTGHPTPPLVEGLQVTNTSSGDGTTGHPTPPLVEGLQVTQHLLWWRDYRSPTPPLVEGLQVTRHLLWWRDYRSPTPPLVEGLQVTNTSSGGGTTGHPTPPLVEGLQVTQHLLWWRDYRSPTPPLVEGLRSPTPPLVEGLQVTQHLLWWRDYRSPNTSSGGGTTGHPTPPLVEGLQVTNTSSGGGTTGHPTPPLVEGLQVTQHLLWWRDYRSPNTSSEGISLGRRRSHRKC
ncbi:unnamed protein product [Boreogadus saida]